MAVRPIDGNELVDTLKQIISDYTSHGMYPSAFPIEYAIEIVEEMPTLTPPNEPRVINADKLAKRIAGHSNYHGDSILAAIYCAAEGKENDAPIRPIETPPNEPLTLDELREMDGEPVYVVFRPDISGEKSQSWALVNVDEKYGEVYLVDSIPGASCYYDEIWANLEGIYRRPPERQEDKR